MNSKIFESHLLSPEDAIWRSSLEVIPHDVYHLPSYAELDATLNGGRAYAFLYREYGLTMLQPVVVSEVPNSSLTDACSPYGYSGPVSNAHPENVEFWRRATASMVRTFVERGVIAVFVRMHPLIPISYHGLTDIGSLVRHGETVSVDLRLSPEIIWQRTRRSHRRAITQARRAEMKVCIDDWEYFDRFVETYQETMARVGASAHYCFGIDYFTQLRRALGRRVHLAAAIVDGTFVGGLLFFYYRGIANAHLSCTKNDNEARGASKLIDDEVRLWTQAQGGEVYHLGGGLGGEKDKLFDYKFGFSTDTHPFYTWRIVTSPPAYEALVRQSRSNNSEEDVGHGYFPAYRHR